MQYKYRTLKSNLLWWGKRHFATMQSILHSLMVHHLGIISKCKLKILISGNFSKCCFYVINWRIVFSFNRLLVHLSPFN